MEIKFAQKNGIEVGSVSSKEELLDKTSDALRKYAHATVMLKKAVTLQTDVTEEDFDKAFEKEVAKEWDKVKDLDIDGYMLRVIGEMMMDGIDPERIFGKDDGEKDS